MKRLFARSILLSLVIFASASPATAGKKEDILALQQQVADMRRQLSELTSKTGQSDADALVQISTLQRENQLLTGRVEALNHELEQMRQRLDSVTRLLAGENFSGIDAGVNSAPGFSNGGLTGNPVDLSGGNNVPTADGFGEPLAQGDERQTATDNADVPAGNGATSTSANALGVVLPQDSNAAYEYANGFLLSGDYTRAREAFALYIQQYPSSPYTPDAQFRLGEIYLATGDNGEAAQSFIAHIRNYPNDPRAAEAYLKLGTAFVRLEEPNQACEIFKQVRLKFPGASSVVLERTDLEMSRINCR